GYRGWVLCRLLAWHERMIVLKERELKDRPIVTPAWFHKRLATGLWPVVERLLLTSETAKGPVGTACIPSTRIMFVLAVRCRILRGSRYSSQFSHSLARSADSN